MNRNEKKMSLLNEGEPQGDAATQKKAGHRGKFNFIDFLLILVVLAVVAMFFMYLIPGVVDRITADGEIDITYVIEFKVDDAFIANIQNGDTVFSASKNFNMGTVRSVATDSYTTLVYDSVTDTGVLKEHPDIKTLIITVSGSAVYSEGEGYSINGERIAVGREYDFKFPNFTGKGYCTDVEISTK